jgi:hypothetical protein
MTVPLGPEVTRCHAELVEVAVYETPMPQGVTMTAGYRDFRPRDEDPSDHAAVAAMQARSEAVKADEAFRQAMLAAIAAGQECAPTAVSTEAGTKVPKIIRGE